MSRVIVVAALFAITSAAVAGCADGTQDPIDIDESTEATEPEKVTGPAWSNGVDSSLDDVTYGLRASKAGTVFYPFSTSTTAAPSKPSLAK